jgi:hypothetical protein
MFSKVTHKSREQVIADALKHWLERPATPRGRASRARKEEAEPTGLKL